MTGFVKGYLTDLTDLTESLWIQSGVSKVRYSRRCSICYEYSEVSYNQQINRWLSWLCKLPRLSYQLTNYIGQLNHALACCDLIRFILLNVWRQNSEQQPTIKVILRNETFVRRTKVSIRPRAKGKGKSQWKGNPLELFPALGGHGHSLPTHTSIVSTLHTLNHFPHLLTCNMNILNLLLTIFHLNPPTYTQ